MRKPPPDVPTGFPSPASDHHCSELNLGQFLRSNRTATFVMKMDGDSMMPAGIFEGDVVVIDRSVVATFGARVVVWHEGKFHVRILRKLGRYVYLQPANYRYDPFIFDEHDDLEIWGVVVGIIRQYNAGK